MRHFVLHEENDPDVGVKAGMAAQSLPAGAPGCRQFALTRLYESA
jgi:hypothetical protein